MFLSLLVLVSLTIINCNFAAGAVIERAGNITLQAPIVATPSQHWEGVDGTWSTFEIRVGSASQVFRVLPATSWQETWVIWNTVNACNASLGVASDCVEARGGAFESQSSSSWHDEGQFTLGLNTNLGYGGVGDYGFDTVGLGYTNSTGVTLTHQIVAEIQSDTFWFGILGLGFQPTNFSDYGNPQASFSDTLVSNGTISSMSWSYTAGAYYRLKGIFGSLIFGGYDASRFTPNDVVFTMTGDNLRDIVLYVRTVTSTTSSGNTTLSSTPFKAFIDSTIPDFWFPVSVCQAFEKAFGLQLDNATGRYLVNASAHNNLASMNPNVTITLGDQETGGHTVDLVFPYGAFDLNLTAPFINGTSYYFPLRQGTSDSMYTLGRAFLQETYVTADYNTRTFNVSQSVFNQNANAQIVAIPSNMPVPVSGGGSNGTGSGNGNGNGGGSGSGSGSSGGLSGGTIAGIVIGVVVVIVIIGGFFFCCSRRRLCFAGRGEKRPSTPIHEIDSGKRLDPNASAYSAQASALTSEVPGQDAKVEIAGNPIMHPQELEAEVPMSAYDNPIYHRVNGPSSSSDNTAYVSSMSQGSSQGKPPEKREAGRGLPSSDEEELISPTSPSQQTLPNISVSSPADTHMTWSPQTPAQHQGSDFHDTNAR